MVPVVEDLLRMRDHQRRPDALGAGLRLRRLRLGHRPGRERRSEPRPLHRTATKSLATTSGRLTCVPRPHPDGPGQEPTATSLHEEALGRNQHKTTRKVGWRLEGNQVLPPKGVVKGSR